MPPYGFNPFTGKLGIKASTVSASYSGDVTVFRGTAKEFKLGDEVFEMISTGLYAFDGLSHDGTTFTVGAGDGHIVDKENNLYYDTPWAAIAGNSPATANGVTYVFIDNTGSVFTQTSIPIPDNLRDRIYIGRVITQGGVIVQVQDEPVVILHTTNQFYDLGKALGIFNVSGNEISANGTNLNINKSLGYLFSLGSNYTTNVKNPHEVTIAATSPTTFAYITQLSGSTGASTITIDPANYDVAGTITAIPGSSNRASIQRVFAFPSSNIRIQYGQNWYNNLSEALQAVNTGSFVINPSIPGNGVLIGLIVVIKGATTLNDPAQAQFLLASRFGQSSIGAAGRSVTSLQQAYNNSITPEIVVDANNGAVTIKDAVTPIGANLFEVTDNSDSPVFEVDLLRAKGIFQPTEYTNATWPDPTTSRKNIIWLSPDNIPIYSNGTNWVDFAGNIQLPPSSWAALKAYQLDGVNEYFTGPDATALSVSGASACTVEILLNFNMNRTKSAYLWSFYDGSSEKFEVLWINSQFRFTIGAGSTYTVASPSRSLKNYHIVCVFDGSLGSNTTRAKIYVDGTDITAAGAGTIGTSLPTSIASSVFNVASRPSGVAPFDDKVIQCSMWNRALTSGEVSTLYNSGSYADPTSISGCLASWWFGDNASDNETIVNDNVASYNLTPINIEAGDVITL